MSLDLKAIEQQIKRLQKLHEFGRELQGDPEFAALVEQYFAKNGNRPKVAPSAANGGNDSDSSRPRGYFIGAIRGAIAQLPHEFTSEDIEKILQVRGIEILAANPNVAINDALGTLLKRGEVMRKGKRGVQVVWKKAISAVESRTA